MKSLDINNFFEKISFQDFPTRSSLNRFLNDKEHVLEEINEIITGKSEFIDSEGKQLFKDRFEFLKEENLAPEQIYDDILNLIFKSDIDAGLNVVRLKNTEGEIGLRVGRSEKYFGLISIGDPKKFTDRIEEKTDIPVEEQEFKESLFRNIDSENSDINILVGAKKFVEGWDSYRVSNMGLMNVGKSEGSEIIQIFGRGIRLKGYKNSLKRTNANDNISKYQKPRFIEILERLNVFGVKAGYIEKFEEKLQDENIPTGYKERQVSTEVNYELLEEDLKVPRQTNDKDFSEEVTMKLQFEEELEPSIDLYPKVRTLRSEESESTEVDKNVVTTENESFRTDLVEWDEVFVNMIEFKEKKDYHNLILSKEVIKEIINKNCFSLKCPGNRIKGTNIIEKKEKTEELVEIILKRYLEDFYTNKKSNWEDKQREYQRLEQEDTIFELDLSFSIPENDEEALEKIEKEVLSSEYGENKYVFNFDRSLYQPLFVKRKIKEEDKFKEVKLPSQALNKGEEKVVEKLKDLCDLGVLEKESVYLLRNPQKRGIGFAEGGYPDFILWIKSSGVQHIVFIDPHGMVFESDDVSKVPKIMLKDRVKEIEEKLDDDKIKMSSYVISTTDYDDHNPSMSRKELNKKYNLFYEREDNLKDILKKENII